LENTLVGPISLFCIELIHSITLVDTALFHVEKATCHFLTDIAIATNGDVSEDIKPRYLKILVPVTR